MLFEDGQKIVFIGDSITDCGRRDVFAPYGSGYMSLVQAFVAARYPERRLQWENRGISGNRVRDLDARWMTDVIAEQPDWLSVKIGINDVWRRYGPNPEEAVPPDEYAETLRRLVQHAIDETGCQLIMVEPYVIEKDRDEDQRVRTAEMAAIARGIGEEFGAIRVATQEAFDAALTHSESVDWSNDRIHPNLAGHAVIAQAFLKAIEFEF